MSDVGSVQEAPQSAAAAGVKSANDQQKLEGEQAVSLIESAVEAPKNVDPSKGQVVDIQA